MFLFLADSSFFRSTTDVSQSGGIPQDIPESELGPTYPKTPGAPSEEGGLPPMVFGGIGIAAMVVVVGGLLVGLNIFRRRRQHPVLKRNFRDSMQPTYNSNVVRSRHAPVTGRFDNIRYDSERHPSGVYDVPASTATTPGGSHVAQPAFPSAKVKVDVEPDEEDEYAAFASPTTTPVIVVTQSVALGSAPAPRPRPKLQILSNSFANAYAITDVTTETTKPPLPPRTESMVEEMARKMEQVRGSVAPADSPPVR